MWTDFGERGTNRDGWTIKLASRDLKSNDYADCGLALCGLGILDTEPTKNKEKQWKNDGKTMEKRRKTTTNHEKTTKNE